MQPHPDHHFREVFPDSHPMEWEINHIICKNYLSKRGDVKWDVVISLRALKNGLDYYEWRIPLPKEEQKRVYGLTVKNGIGELLDYDVYYLKKQDDSFIENIKNPDVALIRVRFPSMKKNDLLTLHFEYYIEKWADILKKTPLKSKWRYSWAYLIFSKTRKFEFWVIPPEKSNIIEINSNLQPIKFVYGNQETVIYACKNPRAGDLWGEIIYEQESPLSTFFISLSGGIIFSAIFTLLGTLNIDYLSKIFVIFLASIIGTFIILLMTKKTLPTFKL